MKEKMDVNYIAKLARLDLNPEERDKLSSQMNDILSYVEKLNELDTSHVDATLYILPVHNVTRPDKAVPSLDTADVLKNAPESRDYLFIVPQVIE
jgi:aspartyl-tRNA(Asn)/glutamyl-tRNA(Gln) amidotransferase subunit C